MSTRLLFGFAEVEIAPGQRALLASAQKALVDLLYLTPHSDQPKPFCGSFASSPPSRLTGRAVHHTVQRVGSRKVERAVRLLLERWDDEAVEA